jgi:guanylate kinase
MICSVTKGILFVLSSPSGGGKTTILKKVMADLPGLAFSVSHTTRPRRQGEEDGFDYHFVSRKTFQKILSSDSSGFLEWAEVYGNLYGTSREEVVKQIDTGKDVILDIDVQGAIQVQQSADPVSIFVSPPSMKELERRLRHRGTENEKELKVRLENAVKELALSSRYDYFIVNDRLDDAVESLRAIIISERSRRRRSPAGLPVQLKS